MGKNVVVNQIVKYAGHNVKANGSVDLTFKAKYGELGKSVELLQLLNINDVKIKVKVPGMKTLALGSYLVRSVHIDGDGESVIKLNGLSDFIEMDNLNKLLTAEGDEFRVRYEAEVELEEELDEEE